MTEVTCPTCGTVSHLDDANRDAGAFCRVCDYPLFWIRTAATGSGMSELGDDPGLRRLPGTAGLVTLATLSCWNCDENNPVTGAHCLRCGVDLHPAPPVLAPAPVPVEPAPAAPAPPPRKPWIPAAWVPAAIAAAALVLWCLVGVVGLIVG